MMRRAAVIGRFVGVVAPVFALLLLPVRVCPAIESTGELADILKEHGILFNAEAAQEAAVEGMLKVVDPRARILSREEALKLKTDWTGLPCLDDAASPGTNLASDAGRASPVPAIATTEEWEPGIAYVKLNGLYAGTGSHVVETLRSFADRPRCVGLVLDARGTDGADLESGDAVAGLFDGPTGVLYRIQDSRGEAVQEHTRTETAPLKVPVMLLTDRRTACAGQVLAAVLERSRGVMLIGAPTQGDTHIRKLIPLPDGRFLLVASQQIVFPDGASYEGEGVSPDVLVDAGTGIALRASADVPPKDAGKAADAGKENMLKKRVASDAVLARAVDILLGLRALGVHAAGQSPDPAR
jgi:hypothetical protein